jgi:hypothetical protein
MLLTDWIASRYDSCFPVYFNLMDAALEDKLLSSPYVDIGGSIFRHI